MERREADAEEVEKLVDSFRWSRNRPVYTPTSDYNLSVFLLQPFPSPAIENMDLSSPSGANFVVVSPFVSGRESGE
jgi:hypothetical protein